MSVASGRAQVVQPVRTA